MARAKKRKKQADKVWAQAEEIKWVPETKRVKINTAYERVIKHAEFNQMMENERSSAHNEGLQDGFRQGIRKMSLEAWSDLSNVWGQVAQAHAAAERYSQTIAQMYLNRLPKAKNEEKGSE